VSAPRRGGSRADGPLLSDKEGARVRAGATFAAAVMALSFLGVGLGVGLAALLKACGVVR
jgi:hypothetical protein